MLTQSRARHFVSILMILVLAVPPIWAAPGSSEFKQGKKAEAAGDYDKAVGFYQQAVDKNGKNTEYVSALRRMRFTAAMKHVDKGHQLRDTGKLDEALAEFQAAMRMDPGTAIADQEANRTLQMIEMRKKAANPDVEVLTPQQAKQRDYEQKMMRVESPAELAPKGLVPAMKMTNESRIVFETIGKLAGVNVLTDPDYQNRRITLELATPTTLEQALDYAGILSKTKWAALSPNSIVIYQENSGRQREPMVLKTIYLSNMTQPQDITEITQVLRNALDITKIIQVNSQAAIIIRATPDQVAVAEKLINDLDRAKAEVVVDVVVMAVSHDLTRQLGLTPVTGNPPAPGLSLAANYNPNGVTTTTNNTNTGTGTTTTTTTTNTSTTSGQIPLSQVGRTSINQYTTTLPSVALNAVLSNSNAKLLQNPQIRASDGQTAKLRVGERVPIATGTFSTGIVATGGLPAAQTSFQYTDVGVIMEITPRVNGLHEVSMKVVVEISAVDSHTTIGGVDQPIIGQRRVEQDIRLKEGEVNVLGGIIQDQSTITKAGVPVLGSIPVLGRFFSTNSTTISQSEVLIMLTPRIVRSADLSELNLRGIDTGTLASLNLRYKQPAGATVISPPSTPPVAPPVTPGVGPNPSIPPDTSAGGTQLRFSEANVNATVGNNFAVNLELVNAQDVNAVPFQVRFDPKVVKLVNVVLGDVLSKDGQTANMAPTIDAENGTGMVAVTRPPGVQGISGSGRLVTFNFQAIAPGTANIQVSGATARGPSREPRPLSPAQTTVTVK